VTEFTRHLLDLLADFGAVRCRRMFGGYGVYRDELMFALVAGDTLYLKADDQLARQFRERGLAPFDYARGGRRISLSYYQAPEEALEDSGELQRWAALACAAALRARRR